MSRLPAVILALAGLAAGPALAAEADRPLLELGLAGGGGWLPDYPASSQNHLKGIVAPYVIYRGRILRSDETGVRGRFFTTERVALDVSLGGSLPASSDDNNAREGMPDLDLMGEIGPNLRLTLDRRENSRLDLNLALRGVFTTDFSDVVYRGLVFAPEIAWKRVDLLVPGSRLRIGAGPIFATDRYMDYFYEVDPRDERSGRPEYNADPGYVGTQVQGSFRVPLSGRLSVVGGGRAAYHEGAANDDSPLYKRDLNLSVVGGFSYSFYQSTARVRVADDRLD